MEQSGSPGFEELRAFVQIAQDGSFSRAAHALGVPKATLSRRLADLERRLGVQLLIRTTRTVQVSAAGRGFLPEAVAVLTALEDAAARVRELGGEPRGRLKLTAGVEYGAAVLAPLLAEFAAAQPAIELAIELTDRRIDLVHEGFDLAIWVGAVRDPALALRRLGALGYGLYASPAYLAAHGRPRYAHELAEHPALQFVDGDAPPSWTLTDGRQSLEVPIRARVRANDHRTLCEAAHAGLGIAFCAEFVAEREVAAGRLERLLPSFGAAEIPVHAVFSSPRVLTPKLRALLDFLVARLAVAETA